MSKGRTKSPYKMSFTMKELKSKEYRKYRYPQEIDGITFTDEVERKLSESSWFRCPTPTQQLVIEKQLRLRAKGEYNHKFLHYEDNAREPALGICKSVLTRLVETLDKDELQFFFSLVPYIHVNDGILRNKDRELLSVTYIRNLLNAKRFFVLEMLSKLDAKRLLFCNRAKITPDTKEDIYLPLASRASELQTPAAKDARELIIYANPYIVFFGQYIDKYVMPYFDNSAWYVINPYAARIHDWIDHNCK